MYLTALVTFFFFAAVEPHKKYNGQKDADVLIWMKQVSVYKGLKSAQD